MSSPLVWIITGTSTGIGRLLTEAALKRGDKVIATTRKRSLASLDDLKTKGADILELDVTDTQENLNAIAKTAVAIHGRIDVVVNNAGYLHAGPIEANTTQETFDQFNTNVFGALNVTRAFLPYMRERKTGTFIFFGSIVGWSVLPNAGLYSTTKLALRGISAALHKEIAPLGLRSTCIDLGYFRTSFLVSDHRKAHVTRIPDYEELSTRHEKILEAYNGNQPGDPEKGVQVIVDIVHGDGQAKGKGFPISVALGSDCFETAKSASEEALSSLELWAEVSKSTDF